MNFFTKTLSTFTGSSIPYTFKEKIIDASGNAPTSALPEVDRSSIWNIYNGINPKDSAPVSIFEFNLREPRTLKYEPLARNAFKKLKLIKYPGIITILDFIDNDSYLYIVTERVVPLALFFNDHKLSQEAIVAGLHDVEKSLKFINEECNSLHGGLDYYKSVFVNSQGDWKLMAFELVTNLQSDPDQPIYRLSQYMPKQEDVDFESIRRDPTKFDSYKLGNFVYAVFNKGVVDTNFKIPVKLVGPTKRLLSKRNTVAQYLKELESWHEQNVIIRLGSQLNALKFMNESERLEFIKHELPQYIEEDVYPPGFLDYKLIPELIQQYQHFTKGTSTTAASGTGAGTGTGAGAGAGVAAKQETQSMLLNFLIQFGAKLSLNEFTKYIKPIIFESFASNDRAIRLILLSHLPEYEKHLTDADIQNKIFTPLATGFQDTNFTIRETTLKSITIVIDRISVKQVNQDLLRILAKSQMDPKPSIRVNTLILIIKISSKIYANSKNNVLITALSKSLRDPFVPCKLTALNGFESLIDEFSLEEICSKILGQLAISLMDKRSLKVRTKAKQVFELYFKSVENHANELPHVDDEDEDAEEREFYKKYAPQQQQQKEEEEEETKSTVKNVASGFGWGMVSKFTSLGALAEGKLNNDFNRSTPDIVGQVTHTTQKQIPTVSSGQATNNDTTTTSGWDDDFNDDWNMNDDDDANANDEDEDKKEIQTTIVESTKKLSLDRSTITNTKKTLPKKTLKTTSSLRLGGANKASKPKVKPVLNLNLKVDDNNDEDGWDDGW
ncbi:CEX1 [Candida oxycetoniae]|uniref:CEX1 n=1 Tax=Candida oxycetoniae TaxID=497107 RepID=A0AAI9SXZ7_9ASCO|nr:CEX1 [Candida oxycetoniae]KAI3404854.2 CEX1 [Candida oxycetoniae]